MGQIPRSVERISSF